MISRILVLGYFGYDTNQLDGQTVKTRNIYKMLQANGCKVDFYDTQEYKKSKLSLFKLVAKTFLNKNIVIIPAGNSLKYVFPFIFLISKLLCKNFIMIPVGGWLCWYLKNKPVLEWMIAHSSAVLPQTMDVVQELKDEYGMKNVLYFPNFRISDFKPSFKMNSEDFHLVFFARIHKMKGLDVMFYIADALRNQNLSQKIHIDFWGQINPDDEEYFTTNVAKYDFVEYRGFLEPSEINSTLSQYDIMLFPTRYIDDEGFPGSILDAYMSGVPVIASNWCHSKEFVNDGISGFICDINNLDGFVEKVMLLYNNRELLLKMRRNAFEESKKYSDKAAFSIISELLR